MIKPQLNLSLCISGVLFIFGAAVFTQATKMTYWKGNVPGDAFMPIWASGFLMLLALIGIFQALKEQGVKLSDSLPRGEGLKNLLVTWTALIFFMASVKILGFLIPAFVMMFFLYKRGYKPKYAIIWAIAVTLATYFVFDTLLQIPLPVNQFGW